MSFDPSFERRWTDVIEPAIRELKVGQEYLKPVRVDRRKSGNSVQVEILEGIRNCLVFFADITTVAYYGPESKEVAVRNANVAYEIGVAQATKPESEVVLFRSDSDGLPFDITNMRVNTYNPDGNTVEAKALVKEAIVACSNETDLLKNMAVQHIAGTLDLDSCLLLIRICVMGKMKSPPHRKFREILVNAQTFSSLRQLLTLGLIRSQYPLLTLMDAVKLEETPENLQTYVPTDLGIAVQLYIAREMKVQDWNEDEVRKHLGSDTEAGS